MLNKMLLGEQLLHFRKAAGYSYRVLIEEMEKTSNYSLTAQTISKYEKGGAQPSVEFIVAFCKVIADKVPMQNFMTVAEMVYLQWLKNNGANQDKWHFLLRYMIKKSDQ
jgi:transcriptional regulator with XRE-family HTH domain